MSTPAPFQFGIASLLLITALVAVIMSVSVMVPGIGIALAMASVPALLRTYVLVRRKRENGEPVTNQDKAVLFVACLGVAVLIAIATGAAFFVPCFVSAIACSAIGDGNNGLVVGGMIGAIAGLVTSLTLLVYLLRKWFKYSPNKPATGELLHAQREDSNKLPVEEPLMIEPVPREPRTDSPPEPLVQSPEPTTKPPGDTTP